MYFPTKMHFPNKSVYLACDYLWNIWHLKENLILLKGSPREDDKYGKLDIQIHTCIVSQLDFSICILLDKFLTENCF